MSHKDIQPAEDVDEIVRRLRSDRPQASGLELDRMKTTAMARAGSGQRTGGTLKARIVTALLAVGLMAGGTGGVLAASSKSKGNGNTSASSQYKACAQEQKVDQHNEKKEPPGLVRKCGGDTGP